MSLALASLFVGLPRFLALAGFIGDAAFLTRTIAEVFGIPIGLTLSIPAGLFELARDLWLLGKSFQAEADAAHVEVALTTIVHRGRATL